MPYKEGKKWRATPKYKGIRGKTKVCKTKKEALEWERQEKDRLKEIVLRQQSGMDLLTLTGKYLDYAERHSAKTYDEKQAVCKRILKAWGKDMLVDLITADLAIQYLNEQKRERSANAANKDRKNLLRMFNWGNEILGLSHNPFSKITKFAHDPKPSYTPPVEDVLRLLAVCTRSEKVFLDAYLKTGARRSETFRWQWHGDINFERKQVRIGTRKTRDGSMEYRWLNMSGKLYESLWWLWNNRGKNPKLKPEQKKVIKRSPYVFVNDHPGPNFGKPFKYRQRFMNSLCERAKIKPFGFHALRRFVASLLDDKKVPLERIRRILGHSKVSTTDRYIKNIRGDNYMQDTMDLLTIEDKTSEKNNKVHIYGTHSKKKKESE